MTTRNGPHVTVYLSLDALLKNNRGQCTARERDWCARGRKKVMTAG